MEEAKCSNCRFWRASLNTVSSAGQCREESAFSGGTDIWPSVTGVQWCGRHQFPLSIALKRRGLTMLSEMVKQAEVGDPVALAALADMEMRAKGL
jgi:hypothetical protein